MNLPRDVILFATADWDRTFWTNKQHLACDLARKGFRVLYVESLGLRRPTTRSCDLSRIARRLIKGLRPVRQVRDRIWVFSPLVIPFHGKPLFRKLNDFLLTHALRGALHWLDFQDPMVWTYHPMVLRLMDRLPWSRLVYHCVDNLAAAPHMPVEVIQRAEHKLVQAADAVFTTSQALQDAWAKVAPEKTFYFPNVADFEHFSQARQDGPIPEDLARIPRPRLGFIGAVSDYKVDFEVIAAIAKQRPDWHWVLVGQVGEGQPWTSVNLLKRPNIHLLGPRSHEVLPDYLRGFDLATIPACRNAYTEAMFPMKFFEYLAAGKSVVALNVPALNEFSRACRLTDSQESFSAAIEDVLAGQATDQEHCLNLARKYTWEWRMKEMLKVLEEKPGVTVWADPSKRAA